MSIPHYEGSEIDQKIEDLTVEEARGKILEYYKEHEGESIYPDDVADELGLDLKITMQAVKELMKEGSLKEEK
jgi:DNA-binding MarR family transcriptional regulator